MPPPITITRDLIALPVGAVEVLVLLLVLLPLPEPVFFLSSAQANGEAAASKMPPAERKNRLSMMELLRYWG